MLKSQFKKKSVFMIFFSLLDTNVEVVNWSSKISMVWKIIQDPAEVVQDHREIIHDPAKIVHNPPVIIYDHPEIQAFLPFPC